MGHRRNQQSLHPWRTSIERRPFSNALPRAGALAGFSFGVGSLAFVLACGPGCRRTGSRAIRFIAIKAPNGWISHDLNIWNELDRRGFVSKGFVLEIPDLRHGSERALDGFYQSVRQFLHTLEESTRAQLRWSADSDYREELLSYKRITDERCEPDSRAAITQLEAFMKAEPAWCSSLRIYHVNSSNESFCFARCRTISASRDTTRRSKPGLEKPEQAELVTSLKVTISPEMKPERQAQTLVNQAKTISATQASG